MQLTETQFTIGQVAKRLGFSYRWVAKLIRRGDLQATYTESQRGREWRVSASQLARYESEKRRSKS